MKELIAGFSKQLEEAINIGKSASFSSMATPVHNVIICGLGGSGIGGSIVSELVADEAKVPITVHKGYFLPAYTGENTLAIISSYSGNTEETLNALQIALEKKAKVVCITSGGKIGEIAREQGLDLILVPGGMPPRACLGYTLTQLFFTLNHFEVIGNSFLPRLKESISLIDREEEKIKAEAQQVAEKLMGRTPVIYSTTHQEGLAIRLRQQLNENSKILCWHHVFPELNHNELVGWTQERNELAIVILRDPDEYSRNVSRIEISKEVFSKYTSTIVEVYAKGASVIEKAVYLIHLGDWISWYLAERRGVDAVEVSVINHLKSELSKI